MNSPSPHPERSRPRGARLRIVATVILVLGVAAALLVYATGTAPDDLSADVATARSSKSAARNIEINSGKMGVMMSNWMDDLQDPGTQAIIILVLAALPAAGCFYVARLLDHAPAPEPSALPPSPSSKTTP